MTDHNKNQALGPPDSDHSSPPAAEPYTPDRTITEFELFEYYPKEDTYRAFYDADRESPSTAIVSAVAAVSDTDPLDMDPLHTTVDTDALNSLITPHRAPVGDSHVTFEYCGCEVTASSYGGLKVRPLEASLSPPAVDD
jgi:hypothetical protein